MNILSMKRDEFTRRLATLLLIQEGYVPPSIFGIKSSEISEDVLSDLHTSPINNSERKGKYGKQR